MQYTKGQAKKAIFVAANTMQDIYLDEDKDRSLDAPAREIHGTLGELWVYLWEWMQGNDNTQVQPNMNANICKALSQAGRITEKYMQEQRDRY